MHRTRTLIAGLTLAAAPVFGVAAFELHWPVDCIAGETCFIQNYVDRDPGPDARDHHCGALTYDGHRGTDIRVPTHGQIGRDAPAVLAAAPGIVRGLRDRMLDRSLVDKDSAAMAVVQGKECGNGVLIDHGDGWVSQYCHLAQFSVAVEQGQQVAAGDILGRIGLSGATEFPHLHFSLRKDGETVDPFAPGSPTCGPSEVSLWADTPDYIPGALLATGTLDRVPEFSEIRRGLPERLRAENDLPLVLWAYAFGAQAEDALRFEVSGGDRVLFDRTIVLEKTQAEVFRAFGRRAPPSGWQTGTYTARITFRRDGAVLSEDEFSFEIILPE